MVNILAGRVQVAQVLRVACIGHAQQALIKPALIDPRLVPSHKQNGFAPGVKGKSYAPNLIAPGKAQFFHVVVVRTLQRIHRWAAKLRAKTRQQACVREQLVL